MNNILSLPSLIVTPHAIVTAHATHFCLQPTKRSPYSSNNNKRSGPLTRVSKANQTIDI